jgi:hypothetical protein
MFSKQLLNFRPLTWMQLHAILDNSHCFVVIIKTCTPMASFQIRNELQGLGVVSEITLVIDERRLIECHNEY